MIKENGFNIDNTYLKLNNKMYSKIDSNNIQKSKIVQLNLDLVQDLDLNKEFVQSDEGVHILTGSSNILGPLYAQAYGGHQYGHFTMLGDGRATFIGEHLTNDGKRFDIQLKGAGRTPYSRGGDGKATLYSMLREYLISEAMHHLNIPTTRSLAVVQTSETIQRTKMEDAAILTRVASSHIRVGTFEYAKVYGDKELVKELADYSINRHYPNIKNDEDKYQRFLYEVVKRQAELIASWQSIGFIHGVMNTDNVLISGETIDYGPCAFMDIYNPKTVFSSIDQNGRYAYQNQPYIGSWNLSRFAESILELLDEDQIKAVDKANEELKKYAEIYKESWLKKMAAKLGINSPDDDTKIVIDELLLLMEKHNEDFTNTFVSLSTNNFENITFYNTDEWKEWFKKWTRVLGYRKMNLEDRMNLMKKSNPVIIPRNNLVEDALTRASEFGDYSLFETLLSKIKSPYDYTVLHDDLFTKPEIDSEYKTYCGT
jgi:uncharacterized protein YdiU (UPF0061 family)